MYEDRFDLVFSYWIFFWYICYELRITTYNPMVAFYIAVFGNIGVLLLMIYYKNSYDHLLLLCFVLFVGKILPLWSLRNTSYSREDIYIIFVYFFVYILWLFFNDVKLISFYNNLLKNIQKNKPLGPFMFFMLKNR
jgi:hypothetical protein